MNPEYADLDSLNCPLDGLNLIAAAAGTGKTHNIQNLVLRLLLERGLPIESILVVTYTEAAAAELKDRIRLILEKTLAELDRGGTGESREAELITAAASRRSPQETPAQWHATATRRLRQALLDFDSTAIGTIHGFCSRVLREHAFESGITFNRTLEKNSSDRLKSLVTDVYRKYFYAPTHGTSVTLLAEAVNLTLPRLCRLAIQAVERPELTFRFPESRFRGTPEEALEAVQQELESLRDNFNPATLDCLTGIFKRPYNDDNLAALKGELINWRNGTPISGKLLGNLCSWNTDALQSQLKVKFQKKPEWEQEFLALQSLDFLMHTNRLSEYVNAWYRGFLLRATGEIAENFKLAKARENIQTYDDMLRQVREVLHRPGATLGAVLRKRYPAGIIDEFQDTDPVQYDIFMEIFRRGGEPGTLFFVGDPRQAIYAFRGGDIETYRKAVHELEQEGGRRYLLRANYRSSKPMIEAVNRLFHGHTQPFADAEIGFPEVQAPAIAPAGVPRPGLLVHGAEEPEPLRFCDITGLPANAEIEWTARLTAELLNSPEHLLPTGEGTAPRRIEPADITILIRDGSEGRKIRRELARRQVPAVLTKIGSVYKTPEAQELLTFLRAVASPADSGKVAAALVSVPGGFSLQELLDLRLPEHENEWAQQQEQFVELRERWEDDSFYAMFHRMLTLFKVREKCPLRPDGERRLTNLLQLGDLLQRESARRRLGPGGVISCLENAICNADDRNCAEEEQQLLETDRAAVKIMTIHGSKGLEFPVVIVPSLFRLELKGHLRAPYHNAKGKLELDLSQNPDAREREENELLQEHLRLAYVAITRAVYACYCFVGKSQTSPLDWLFRLRTAGPEELASPCRALKELGNGAPEIPAGMVLPIGPDSGIYRPKDGIPKEPAAASWQDGIDRNWLYTSYTKLAPSGDGRLLTSDPADHDDDEPETDAVLPGGSTADPFLLPGGKALGTALHAILETIDFNASADEIRRETRPALQTYGLLRPPESAESRIDAAVHTISATLSLPLTDSRGRKFSLSEIDRKDRLSELEFHYMFRHGFETRELQELLEPFAEKRFGLIEWPPWERILSGGFLTGIIDLVFRRRGQYYIVDWKSNRLEGDPANFSGPRLAGAMCHGFYFLQYLIYTVALVKYLRLRLGRFGEAEYEQKFGGVFYIFLRGAPSGRGVFADRPDYELIRRLEELIG